MNTNELNGVAIIGMSGRFPKAKNVGEFWENICKGMDCISKYTCEELKNYGISDKILSNERYIRCKGEMEDIATFDANFFGYTPREAELMDPQHRKFLECSWEAMEDAGYNPETTDARIGVFAGESMSTYMIFNVLPNINSDYASAESLQAAIGNDKDSLTTTVTYKMDLRGAGVTIQSSSSTSLTAIVMACQSLLNYQNDMVLAGGVSINSIQKCGYLYEERGIMSENGRCCPYDQEANGFVPGTGVGVVVLKRLDEAIEDGDHIYAAIKGFDINNDGARKVSYSAPSVEAQTEVILGAQQLAGFDPKTITYIEGHGTATKVGDIIETKALKEVFQEIKEKKHCVLGSVKGNIGHLDAAAGVASLIKVALSIERGIIPPTHNFNKNSNVIDLEDSPFYVSNELIHWNCASKRRAGVSSFGMGGTNAHIVLEEVRLERDKNEKSHEYKVVLLSAKTKESLLELKSDIDEFIFHNDVNLDDLAYTSQIGRKHFNIRQAVICKDGNEFIHSDKLLTSESMEKKYDVVFMFPDFDIQSLYSGQILYNEEKVFRVAVDKCISIAKDMVNSDIFQMLCGEKKMIQFPQDDISSAQILLFIIEYAMANTLIYYNVQPSIMIGEGVGEYVAACVSGAIDLEMALKLLLIYGRKKGDNVNILDKPEEMEDDLLEVFGHLKTKRAQVPVISSVTGKKIKEFSKEYFIEHMRSIPHIGDGIQTIEAMGLNCLYIEAGPKGVISEYVERIIDKHHNTYISSRKCKPQRDDKYFYYLIASLWVKGININWANVYENKRRRISYPTYVFSKESYWLEANEIMYNCKNKVNKGKKSTREKVSTEYVRPVNQLQEELALIWENMLGVCPIGVNDDFFQMGADSLEATQLFSRIYDKYKVNISYKSFFENPTIVTLYKDIIASKEKNELQDINELLKEVSTLPDEEVDEIITMLR